MFRRPHPQLNVSRNPVSGGLNVSQSGCDTFQKRKKYLNLTGNQTPDNAVRKVYTTENTTSKLRQCIV